MSVRAVIFDWGGTLTPWHQVDLAGLWHEVLAQHLHWAYTYGRSFRWD